MNTLTLLKSKLKPLGIYNLQSGTILNAELSAYAKGLEILEAEIEEAEQECFVSTASTYGIELRERLFGYSKALFSTKERRQSLIYRYKITSNDYTKTKIEEAAKACGIDGYIIENEGKMSFDFNCNNNFESEQQKKDAISEAQSFLPAHLNCTFDFRDLSWDKINENDYTFNQMDQEDLKWNEIDT